MKGRQFSMAGLMPLFTLPGFNTLFNKPHRVTSLRPYPSPTAFSAPFNHQKTSWCSCAINSSLLWTPVTVWTRLWREPKQQTDKNFRSHSEMLKASRRSTFLLEIILQRLAHRNSSCFVSLDSQSSMYHIHKHVQLMHSQLHHKILLFYVCL